MTRVSIKTVLSVAFAGSVMACHEPASMTDGVSALTVTPTDLVLTADDSAPLIATAVSTSGAPIVVQNIAWGSRDTSLVRVDQRGTVFAIRAGTTTVSAFAGSKVATATITGTYPPLTGVRLYAHRGFARIFPENTLVAADSALARGADGVEADVQLTSDSVAVVIHDPTVDRTTYGSGTVSAMSSTEIRALDACSKKGPQWSSCQIPLAEEMIDKLRGRGLLILDLKGRWPDAQLGKLLAMVRDAGMSNTTMVTSFQMDHLRRTRRLDARVTLGLLQGDPTDPNAALALGKVAVIPEEGGMRKNPAPVSSFVALLREHGGVLGAWTIYSQNAVPGLRSIGVQWYIADVPLDKSTLGSP